MKIFKAKLLQFLARGMSVIRVTMGICMILSAIGVMVVCAGTCDAYAQDTVYEHVPVEYFPALLDVPVMPGLTLLPDETLIFDKPDGRIIEEVALVNDVSERHFYRFYSRALPQLGWTENLKGNYIRQDEHLVLKIDFIDGYGMAKFKLLPAESVTESMGGR